MALWKDAQGKVHDDMNGIAVHLLPPECTPITQAEADAILNPPKTQAQIKAEIAAQIVALEREQMLPRVTREALLAAAVTMAAGQGVSEATLYSDNIAYRKMKDFDTMIAGLRAQLV